MHMKTEKMKHKYFKMVAYLILMIVMYITGCGTISDGEYAASVVLEGGSGKAYIESPCTVTVNNGEVTADIVWSSSNYDYMIVDGQTYYPVKTDGGSEFIIPVVLDKKMEVQADTVAMSRPHLIDYTLVFSIENEDSYELSNEEEESDSEDLGAQIFDAPEGGL